MTTLIPLTALVAVLLATSPMQQSATAGQQKPAPAAAVSLIGCVERVPATAPARGVTFAPQVAAYKLIDVQPGASTRTTLKPESQFLLALATPLATPIDLGKHQNQWVEVTGTVTAAPAASIAPQPPTRPAAEAASTQLPTLTLTSLKMVSTECR